jgi:uncharacterized protein YoxC
MSFIAEIQANIEDFQRNLDRARAQMDVFADTVGKRIANLGSKFQTIGGAISLGVTAPMVAAGTAAFNMAADFEDALGATDQIFKQASESTKQWAEGLPTYFGIAKKEALEYSNMMGSMLVNIGNLTEQEASKQSAKLIELAGDLTAMYGGTTQDAVRALTGALKGNTTMLDNYGMAANDALVKAKALSMGLVEQGKEMSLSAKQTATLALIYEQSAAAQGQAAREANGASGSMRAFRTEITNLTTELGAVLLPIITPLIGRLKEITAGFREISPETQKMIVYIGGAVAALGPLLVALGSVMKLAPLVGTAFTVMTGPIGVAVAAIVGAAILIVKNWETIKTYFTSGNGAKIFESIKNSAANLWASLSNIFNKIKDFIIAIWDRIGSNLLKAWSSSFAVIISIVEGAFNFISDIFNVFASLLKGDFKGALDGLKKLFTNVFSSIQKIALNAISGLSSYVAGFLNLIGADSLGAKLQGWADGLIPVEEQTKEVTSVVEEASKAVSNKTSKIKDLGSETEKTTKKQQDFKRELTESLASLGYYDAALASIGYKYKDLSKLAKQAGADAIELGRIAREESGEILTLALGQIDGVKGLKTDKSIMKDFNITPNFSFDIQKVTENLHKMQDEMKKPIVDFSRGLAEDIEVYLNNAIPTAIGSLVESMATALADGGNILEAGGASLLGSLGGIMVDLGKMAIASGIAIKGVKDALLSLNPAVAVAAGVALVAIGSMFKSGASKLGSSMGSSASSGGGSYGSSISSTANAMPNHFVGAYSDNNTLRFEIEGDKFVAMYDKIDRKNRRTR